MSTTEEKAAPVANVLTITRPTPSRQVSNQSVEILSTIEDVDSTHSLTPTHSASRDEKQLEREASPYSPFYNPAHTRYSLEAHKSESKQNINVLSSSAYDTDVEACLTQQPTGNTLGGRTTCVKNQTRGNNMECTVWPSRLALQKKKKIMRKQKGKHLMCCGWIAGLNKKTKIWVKILIALIVVGVAVGVGVGISKAVGGGVWKSSDNSNTPISGSAR